MSSAENVCDVHLVKIIPRKAGHAFLQRLTGWSREFGWSTVGHLSTSLLKCKCTHPSLVSTVIGQSCNHSLYLSSKRLAPCCSMAITELSLIQV